MKKVKRGSALGYVIEALIPFTDANLALAFRPHVFFNELDQRGTYSPKTLQNAYYRAQKQGLVVWENGSVHLSAGVLARLSPADLPKLPGRQQLVVIFDIPEDLANKRRQLRTLLKELKFLQVQRSVWQHDVDYRVAVNELVKELELDQYVKLLLATVL